MGTNQRKIYRLVKSLIIVTIVVFAVADSMAQCTPNPLTQTYPGCSNCYSKEFILSGSTPNCESYNGYTLVFEDNFNDTHIDASRWHTCYPYGQNGSCMYATFDGNNVVENAFYSANNVSTSNGKLFLKIENVAAYTLVKELPDIGDCNNGTTDPYLCNLAIDNLPNYRQFNYRSGVIYSKQKYPSGKFEIRCKIPGNSALWPSFWLWWGGWHDAYQEIDVFEFNKPNSNSSFSEYIKPQISIHRNPYMNQHQEGSGIKYNCSLDTNSFHKYAVEWDKYMVVFYIDDIPVRYVYPLITELWQPVAECNSQIASAYYFRNRLMPVFTNMSIIAGSGVKHINQGNYPVNYEIDYIKYWKKVDCSNVVNICSWNPNIKGQGQTFSENTEDPTVYTGRKIIVANSACSVTVNNKENLHLVATERIELKPGFTAKEGSFFEAKISPCNTLVTFDKTDETTYNKNVGEYNFINHDFYWSCHPNPATLFFNLTFNIPRSAYAKVYITDITGKMVKTILENDLANIGEHNYTVSTENLSNGTYFVNMLYDNKKEVQRVIVAN